MAGSIPGVCSNLGVSGAAQRFFPWENRPFPKLNRGTLDFDDFRCFLIVFVDFSTRGDTWGRPGGTSGPGLRTQASRTPDLADFNSFLNLF